MKNDFIVFNGQVFSVQPIIWIDKDYSNRYANLNVQFLSDTRIVSRIHRQWRVIYYRTKFIQHQFSAPKPKCNMFDWLLLIGRDTVFCHVKHSHVVWVLDGHFFKNEMWFDWLERENCPKNCCAISNRHW